MSNDTSDNFKVFREELVQSASAKLLNSFDMKFSKELANNKKAEMDTISVITLLGLGIVPWFIGLCYLGSFAIELVVNFLKQ